MISSLFGSVLILSGVLALCVLGYLYFLAVASFWPERRGESAGAPRKFAIVVPAHNEERVLERTLRSLACLAYPKDRFEIVVIADNCTDSTPALARARGVRCWERTDAVRKGKGFALQWAFERLLAMGDHDAFVIVDADTLAHPDLLSALDLRLRSGTQVVQAYYDVIEPEASTMASLSWLGFFLSRNLRYRGRTKLGWTTNLLGNGMCFARDVITRVGWRATSVVEDIEYEMILLLNGVRVAFAPEAKVYAEIPGTFGASRTQRGRWDVGKFKVRNTYVPKLLKRFGETFDPAYLDASLELVVPPFALFALLCAAGCVAALVAPAEVGPAPRLLWGLTGCLLLGYIGAGLAIARGSWRIYRSLLYAPYFILWRAWVNLEEYWKRNAGVWVRTERDR